MSGFFLIHQERHCAIDPVALEQLRRELIEAQAGKGTAVVVPVGVRVEYVERAVGGLGDSGAQQGGSGVGARGRK